MSKWRYQVVAQGLLIVTALFGCGGCGLIFIPVIEHCPVPVREVVVCDDVSGHILTASSVKCVVVNHEDWGEPGRPLHASTELGPLDRRVGNLSVIRQQEGRFRVKRAFYLAAWQWFFPMFTDTTWWSYHGHLTLVIASAPKHSEVKLSIPPGLAVRELETQVAADGRFEVGEDGTVKVFLRPEDDSTRPANRNVHANSTSDGEG